MAGSNPSLSSNSGCLYGSLERSVSKKGLTPTFLCTGKEKEKKRKSEKEKKREKLKEKENENEKEKEKEEEK